MTIVRRDGMYFDAADRTADGCNWGRVQYAGRNIRLLDNAEATSRCLPDPNRDGAEYVSHGVDLATGQPVCVYWVFTRAQMQSDDGQDMDPGDYNWDDVDRIDTD